MSALRALNTTSRSSPTIVPGLSSRSAAKTNALRLCRPSRSANIGKSEPSLMFELILPHFPPQLQEALLSPDYSEICVNEDGRVFVEAAGSNTMLELPRAAPTQVQLRHAVNAMA